MAASTRSSVMSRARNCSRTICSRRTPQSAARAACGARTTHAVTVTAARKREIRTAGTDQQRRLTGATLGLFVPGEELLIFLARQELFEFAFIRQLDLDQPPLVGGIFVSQRRMVLQLAVDRSHRTAHGRDQLLHGAHRLELAER